MDVSLQLWGSITSLIGKVLLSFAEGKVNDNRFRAWGWFLYIISVPAWIIILFFNRNWIAMAIEIGSMPAMVLGFIVAIKGLENIGNRIKGGVRFFIYGVLTLGIFYSIFDFGGITTITQILELGFMIGFLVGSHLIAQKNPKGWIWFMISNGSLGILMFMQMKYILVLHQSLSFCFNIFGFIKSRKNN